MRQSARAARGACLALLIAAASSPASAQVPPLGPPPGWSFIEADVCAVVAIADWPSRSRGGTSKDSRQFNDVHDKTKWYGIDWSYGDTIQGVRGAWGSCPTRPASPNLFFSSDRRYALMEYDNIGVQPLSGEAGYCIYEKAGGRWQLFGCTITALS